MSDLINRELLYENEIPYVNEHFTEIGEKPYEAQPMFSLEQIERQPTIDAIEVVRCIRCKYSKYVFINGLCDGLFCYKIWRPVDDDFYCKWGEREVK